jgi:uncharacterized protein YsxB (DUF464 family)
MLTVTFHRDSRHRLSRIFAEGHVGWDEAGKDIVCAAASALLQAAWLGLVEHAHIEVRADVDASAGRLDLRWAPELYERPGVAAIVETARLAIEGLARQFPDHVRMFLGSSTSNGDER